MILKLFLFNINKGYIMKKVLIDYIDRNKKTFIILISFFIIGIFVGVTLLNNLSSNLKQEVDSYIESVITLLKENNEINMFEMFLISIKENILFILLIWFLGLTIIGGYFIYLTVLYKGFLLGYTAAAFIATLGIKTGTLVIIVSLLMQNVVFIPAMLLISENGIKLCKGIHKKCLNLKEEFIRHNIIMLITIMLILLASFIEVYFSMNLLIFFKEII